MAQSLAENKQYYIREYYRNGPVCLPGIQKFTDICGWTDYYLNDLALFSRRSVFYDRASFPDKLHSHGFYEIDVFLNGTISYVSGNQVFMPQYGDIMIFPPECEHTVRTSRDGIYDRLVLYVEPAWFEQNAGGFIPPLFQNTDAGCYMMPPENLRKFLDCLGKLEQSVSAEQEETAMLAGGYLSLLLAMIGKFAIPNFNNISSIPRKLTEIKEYLDNNVQSVATVESLADQFYYSREHLCRLFKDYYKIPLSEYLRRKKVDRARDALDLNSTVGYAFDISGFQSYSAFVKSFRETTGMTPGKYRSQTGKKM